MLTEQLFTGVVLLMYLRTYAAEVTLELESADHGQMFNLKNEGKIHQKI